MIVSLWKRRISSVKRIMHYAKLADSIANVIDDKSAVTDR